MVIFQEIFHLNDNPFRITPPGPDEPIIWAGCKEFKNEIEKVIQLSLITSPTKIALLWGDWGSGKTHSMRYFCNKNNLEKVCKDVDYKEGSIIPIPITLSRSDVFESFYSDIIKTIGIKQIKNSADTLRSQIVNNKLGIEIVGNTIFKEFYKVLGDPYLSKVLIHLTNANPTVNQDTITMIERYLLRNDSAKDLAELDVATGISSSNDMLKTIVGLFNLLTYKINFGTGLYSRIILWIDQMENIREFSGKEITATQGMIRDLTDFFPSNLLIFINVTLGSGDKLEDVVAYLGDAINARIYRRTKIPPLTIVNDALDYIKELLNHEIYRSKKDSELIKKIENIYFPFDEESIKYAIKIISERNKILNPRWINGTMTCLIELSIDNHDLVKKLKDLSGTITKDFVESNKERILLSAPPSKE